MRYYVVADVHGYFDELVTSLTEKGFYEDTTPHKLIICGDLFDRGSKALEVQNFVLDLMAKDEVILIKGNHEDLALDLLNGWHKGNYRQFHHHTNGTIDTVYQLTKLPHGTLECDADSLWRAFLNTPFIQKIVPAMADYYETEHYIFTHGWIPCTSIQLNGDVKEFVPINDWRTADKFAWDKARWLNGMEAAHGGVLERDKTIVCGHWHCSFGHSHYENDGGEFDDNPNFTPYYGDGIIALDACTPRSKRINCIVVDD